MPSIKTPYSPNPNPDGSIDFTISSTPDTRISLDITPCIIELDTPNNSFKNQNIRKANLETEIAPAPVIATYACDIASVIPYTVKHFCDFNTFCYWEIASYARDIASFVPYTVKHFCDFNAFCYFIYILSLCMVFALILGPNCEGELLDFSRSFGDLSTIISNSDLESECFSDPSSDTEEILENNANKVFLDLRKKNVNMSSLVP